LTKDFKSLVLLILLLVAGSSIAGFAIITSYRSSSGEYAYGPYAFSITVNSLDVDKTTVTLTWSATLYSPSDDKPFVVYFIPGILDSGQSFPFAWFNSSAWRLADTDHMRFWKWQVVNVVTNLPWSERLITIPCTQPFGLRAPLSISLTPVACYPCETFLLNIYMGSTHSFTSSSPPPFVWYAGPREVTIEEQQSRGVENQYLSVDRITESIDSKSLPTDFASRLGQLNIAPSSLYFYHITVEINHRAEVRTLALLGIAFVVILQPIVVWRFNKVRESIGNSNYLQVCVGFLLFLPLLLFSFRTSVAPAWITNLDVAILISMFIWAGMLLRRLWRYSNHCETKDS
jgi:hypothetical protein